MKITKIAFISYILLMLGCGGDSSGTTGTLTVVNETIISQDAQANIKVKIKDKVIYYTGDISEHSYKIFESAVSNVNASSLEKMVINSGGGSTLYGRKLGKFVFDNNLDMQVDEICFSSCANYIFTAGKNKTISKGAFVGWHGNEHQSFALAKIENKSVKEIEEGALREAFKTLLTDLSKEEKDSIIKNQQTTRN